MRWEPLDTSLPTIEEIEAELAGDLLPPIKEEGKSMNSFEEKMARLVAERNGQLVESAKLEKAMRAHLGGLGHGG